MDNIAERLADIHFSDEKIKARWREEKSCTNSMRTSNHVSHGQVIRWSANTTAKKNGKSPFNLSHRNRRRDNNKQLERSEKKKFIIKKKKKSEFQQQFAVKI